LKDPVFYPRLLKIREHMEYPRDGVLHGESATQ
jgi:hypothetical protein